MNICKLMIVLLLAIYSVISYSKPNEVSLTNDVNFCFSKSAIKNQKNWLGKKLVVALGDSITQGLVSFNYVNLLKHNKALDGYYFINAGVNSDLSENLLNRLDAIINCQPDYITILIGTNDIFSTLSEGKIKYYTKNKKLKMRPSFSIYQANMIELIDKLKEQTKAKIAIITIPFIGEVVTSDINKKVNLYNDFLKELARVEDIDLLDYNQSMADYLIGQQVNTKDCQTGDYLGGTKDYISILWESFEQKSKRRGFHLTTDCLHQNEKSAGMISELIVNFLN